MYSTIYKNGTKININNGLIHICLTLPFFLRNRLYNIHDNKRIHKNVSISKLLYADIFHFYLFNFLNIYFLTTEAIID